MCAIAGILEDGSDAFNIRVVVEHMADTQKHRGPDARTIYQHKGLSVCFDRLAVMDTSPEANEIMRWGAIVVWMNGCIYNHLELRDQIKKQASFSTQCDSETVAAMIALKGFDETIQQLNGMFSIVAYNEHTQELRLAVDRYGIKPMYYAQTRSGLVFASTIKAVLQHPGVTEEINPNGIYNYLTYQNQLAEQTMHKGVNRLLPGHTFHVGGRGIRKYWAWDFNEPKDNPLTTNREETAEHILRLIIQAAHKQSCGDRKVAVWLSGGIDSAAIATTLHKAFPTFTAGFECHRCDESREAGLIAYAAGLENFCIQLGPKDMLANLYDTIYHLEELSVGPSWSNFALYRQTAKQATVVLQGTGADEIFGGYPWRYSAQNYRRIIERTPGLYRLGKSICEPEDKIQLIGINDRFEYDANVFLPGVLRVGDKLSGAFGMEERVPFLDNELVDFAMRIPADWKTDGKTGKHILREALFPILSPATLSRRKTGFGSPDIEYLEDPKHQATFYRIIASAKGIDEYMTPGYELHNNASAWSSLSFATWWHIFVLKTSKDKFTEIIEGSNG